VVFTSRESTQKTRLVRVFCFLRLVIAPVQTQTQVSHPVIQRGGLSAAGFPYGFTGKPS
jgi:hypothetical protein